MIIIPIKINNGEKTISVIVLNKKSDARFIPELDHLLSWKLTSIKGSPEICSVLAKPLITSYRSGTIFIDIGAPLIIEINFKI